VPAFQHTYGVPGIGLFTAYTRQPFGPSAAAGLGYLQPQAISPFNGFGAPGAPMPAWPGLQEPSILRPIGF
jgi:hypothetical protein